jgi:hypothetical protein
MGKRAEGSPSGPDQRLQFKNMNGGQKTVFVLKVIVFIITLGVVFPTILSG